MPSSAVLNSPRTRILLKVSRVAPSKLTCTAFTPRRCSRSQLAGVRKWPLVSILSWPPRAQTYSTISKKCGWTIGSPPENDRYGHLLIQQLGEHAHDLLPAQLVAKRLARAALLDAMQAREIAFVGDLPRDVERRTEVSGLRRRRRLGGDDRRRVGRHGAHGAVPSSRPLSRRSAMNASDFALDRAVGVAEALLQDRHDLALVATGSKFADDRRGGRIERVDLLGARLEEDRRRTSPHGT